MSEEDIKIQEDIQEIKDTLSGLWKISQTLPEADRKEAEKQIKEVREYLDKVELMFNESLPKSTG